MNKPSTNSTWRISARRIINGVIDANQDATVKEQKKLISKAYPWGARSNHPYKCWLIEVQLAFPVETEHEATPDEIKNFWVTP